MQNIPSQNNKNHPICIGFDPDISDLHPFLKQEFARQGAEKFLIQWFDAVIEQTQYLSNSLKIQSAFFEQFGNDGYQAMQKIILSAKSKNQFVILDAKRGDISSTMTAYGKAAYDTLQADALTILPWMGTDSLAALVPWLKQGKLVYIVWLSSNQSGRDVQTLSSSSGSTVAQFVFDEFYQLAKRNQIENRIGWVLGATNIPFAIIDTLPQHSHSFLMPGIGAQGATFNHDTIKLLKRHPQSLCPISRGILKANANDTINCWDDYAQGVSLRFKHFVDAYQTANSRYCL